MLYRLEKLSWALLCLGFGFFSWQKAAIADFPATMAGGYCVMNLNGVCQWAPPNSDTLDEACQRLKAADPLGRNWTWNGAPHSAARCGFSPESLLSYQAFSPKSCPANSSPVGTTNSCACNTGFTQSGIDTDASCVAEAPAKSAGTCPSGGQGAGSDPNKPNPCPPGNPINPLTGNKYQIETDYAGAGIYPLRFERFYNSNTGISSGRIGARWRHTFDRSISVSGTNATVFRPDGKRFVFTQSGANWVAPADVMDRLAQIAGGWTYIAAPNDEVETYDADGRLVSIANRAGVAHALVYDGSGRLATVTHLLSGRTLTFSYDIANRITAMTDPAGKQFIYAYALGNLSSVTFPDDTPETTDNPVRSYVYNEQINTSDTNLPSHLTGIVDENSSRFTTYQYAADGRAILTERSGGVFRYSVAYNVDGTSTVTDPLNTARIYGAQTIQDAPRHTGVNQPCDGCGLASSLSYDGSGFLNGATNFNGTVFTYVHNARGLETSRTEAFGTPQLQRTITTQWHTSFRLPMLVTEPGRTTSFDYDTSGNLLTRTVTDTALGRSRTWTYTYDAAGQVLTVNGPRTDVTDVTTNTYDPATGDLETITNAAGHLTQITSYNAHGQPLSITDPNGLVTTLTYDARLRLTSRSAGGESTTYEYDAAGQLTKVMLPDGSFLFYSYDPAHRLTDITDALSNRIQYSELDAMGNRKQEKVFDPLGALKQTRRREFNSLNRLFQEIGAANQTTEFGYDNQGNLTSVNGPLTGTVDVTTNTYDALNRLKSIIDPSSGQVQYGYNPLDQLTSVTDPRNLITSYGYDALGDLGQQVSPDTGTTVNLYDPGGNLQKSTDAKGQETNYTYDALNRVSTITFHDGSKQTYTYDQGTNGIGRLTRIADTDPQAALVAQIDYAYDAKGRLVSDTQAFDDWGTQHTTAYQYDSFGRLATLTYPFSSPASGGSVAYEYDSQRRVKKLSVTYHDKSLVPPATVTRTVVENVQYHPFGGVTGFTFGNAQSYSRPVDQDGRVRAYSLGAASYDISFDFASRITGIAEAGNPSNANTYGYDALDRLTSAVLPTTSYGYTYDATGNRLTKLVGTVTDTYAYPGTSNRLSSITPTSGPVRTYTHDAVGSVTNDGKLQNVYDVRGRLIQSTNAAACLVSKFRVSALGQRVRKTVNHCSTGALIADTLYIYDLAGRLLAETTPTGQYKRAYLYLGDQPVGMFHESYD